MEEIETSIGTAFFFTGLIVLVVITCATRIAINASDFDGLSQRFQID